jgi:hypothetical protein
MFFQTFRSGCHDKRQSLDLPADDQPIAFEVLGNRLTLMVKDGKVVLRWSRRVYNCVQIDERQKLLQRIRRLDEAIGQSVLELMTLRIAWRRRPTAVPNSFEATKFNVLQEKLSMYNAKFALKCTALHLIWTLVPEFGDEHHDWIVPLDGLSAIFLPDLRPGQEGQEIEVHFGFDGKAAAEAPEEALSKSLAKALAAMVTVVPHCCAPYRPFDVPAVWKPEPSMKKYL